MRGAIHHLDLTVRDPWASRDFYAAVLGFMGYRQVKADAWGFDFDCADPAGFCSVGLRKASGPDAGRHHDRYSPGLHHVAWNAAGRQDVDRMYELLLRLGAEILDPPADYPEYGPGYYAVFFADADGLKLEYVFKPYR